MSLRLSLIVSIALVVVFTLIFGAGISYLHALSKVQEEMQAAIAVGGRIAANAVDDVDELSNPLRRLQLLVADFHGDRHLQAMWVDRNNRIAVASKPHTSAEHVPKWFQDLIRQPEQTVRVPLPATFDRFGTFVLKTEQSNEIAEVWDDIWNTLTILAFFCVLVVAILYHTLGRALRPLDQLAGAFSKIGHGRDTPRIAETGPVELVRVYSGFNRMAERLSKSEAHNRRLHEQLSTVQEEERADLARDLHDEIGPFLFSADVDAASINKLLASGNTGEIPARVEKIRETVGHMRMHVKDLLGRLRAAALLDVGLVDAVDNLVNFWRERYPDIAFNIDIPDGQRGELIDGTVFRIVQESLSNALRHGKPTRIDITITSSHGSVRVEIQDDGGGFKNAASKSGYGIAGMRERVSALDGTLKVNERTSVPGVSVEAWLPAETKVEAQSYSPLPTTTKDYRQALHEQA